MISRLCQDSSGLARLLGMLLCVGLLAACSDPLSDFGTLNERIRTYYAAESAGDWETVYAMRAKAFRWSVKRDYFVTAMREDAAGWELLDYRVLDAEESPGKVNVQLQFRYRVPVADTEWARLADDAGVVKLHDTAVWVFDDGEWLCEHAGVRSHLPMSDSLD